MLDQKWYVLELISFIGIVVMPVTSIIQYVAAQRGRSGKSNQSLASIGRCFFPCFTLVMISINFYSLLHNLHLFGSIGNPIIELITVEQ